MFGFFSILGPDLPDPCGSGSMVKSMDGKGVILLGCSENSSGMYQLANVNGTFSWQKMQQEIKYPRSYGVAFLIPDELATCNEETD